MPGSENRYIMGAARLFFLAALLFTAAFFLFRLNGSIEVNTDLKDLSPKLTHDKHLQEAINQLAASIESRFILLLASPDDDALEEAHEVLSAGLADIESLSLAGGDATILDELAGRLAPHRFRLLTEEQRQVLREQSDAQILAAANQNLYQLSGAVRLLPVHEDPFGWFGDYLLQAFDDPQRESADGVIERTSGEGNVTYYKPIIVNIDHGALELDTQQQLVARLEQLEARIKLEFPQLDVYRSGVFFFAAEAATESKRDIGLISIGSTVGIIVLLLLAFSSLWPLVLPFLSIAMGVSFAFAVIYTLFGSVHIITIVFGASLIGIVIDYSLHYFYHQADNTDSDQRSLYRALLFSLLTSVIGYSALGFSSLPSLRQVALFSCAGLIAAWLSVVVLAPLVARRPINVNQTLLPLLVSRFTSAISRFAPFSVYLFCALLLAGMAMLFIGLPVSDNPRDIFSAPAELLEEDRVVSRVVSDFEPGKYLVVTGNQTQEIFDQLAKLKAYSEPGKPGLVTIDQWLPAPRQQQENYALLARLFEENGLAINWLRQLQVDKNLVEDLQAAYREAESAVLEPADIFSRTEGAIPSLWVQHSGRDYSFVLIEKGMDTTGLQAFAASADNVEFIDTVSMATAALKEQRQSSSIILAAAYIFIAVLLLLRYRSFRALSMLTVPLGATLFTLLLLFITHQPITVFHSMALFLVLGLGMDYVIFAEEMKKNQAATLTAIFLSAVTSLLSFGLLSMSSLAVVSAFGLTVLIGNTANLIGTVLYSHKLRESAGESNG